MGRAAMLSDGLANCAEAVCRTYLPNGRRSGAYWIIGDAYNSKGQSCYVRLRGARQQVGRWRDQNPANGDHYGDLLDLIRINRGLDVQGAMAEAEIFLRMPRQVAVRDEPVSSNNDAEQKRQNAKRLWERSHSLKDTRAEDYLRARGLSPESLTSLRYHPNAYYFDDETEAKRSGPAMIAVIRRPCGEVVAVHRTWFDDDRAILRKMMGYPKDGFVDLGGSGNTLLVGEGIETVLSLRHVLPDTSFVAALTASRLSTFEPPKGVSRLLIAVDRDAAGFAATRDLAKRAASMGVKTQSLVPVSRRYGADFNDDLRHLQAQAMSSRIVSNEEE